MFYKKFDLGHNTTPTKLVHEILAAWIQEKVLNTKRVGSTQGDGVGSTLQHLDFCARLQVQVRKLPPSA